MTEFRATFKANLPGTLPGMNDPKCIKCGKMVDGIVTIFYGNICNSSRALCKHCGDRTWENIPLELKLAVLLDISDFCLKENRRMTDEKVGLERENARLNADLKVMTRGVRKLINRPDFLEIMDEVGDEES
jgi:hypothetical protein